MVPDAPPPVLEFKVGAERGDSVSTPLMASCLRTGVRERRESARRSGSGVGETGLPAERRAIALGALLTPPRNSRSEQHADTISSHVAGSGTVEIR